MNTLTIDLETSIKNRGEFAVGKLQAASYHPDNKICWYGVKSDNHVVCTYTPSSKSQSFDNALKFMIGHLKKGTPYTLVGQNIKFDLLYLLRDHYDLMMEYFKLGGKIYCTQLAEYILTGQQEKMIPLSSKKDKDGNVTREGLAVRYGGVDKDDRVAEFWNKGIDTEDIPDSIIEPYLVDDVQNTYKIWEGQQDFITPRNVRLVNACMHSLLMTTFMERNGMRFDLDVALEDVTPLERELGITALTVSKAMFDYISLQVPTLEVDDINPSSTKQLSTFMFGGTWKYKIDEIQRDDDGEPIRYKSGLRKGEIKTKIVEELAHIDGLVKYTDKEGLCLRDTSLGFAIDDELLTSMINKDILKDFCEKVLRYRGLSKDIKTYYEGLTKLTWPTDSCIHGSINHTNTNTGRLSSSAPNMQNITN